MRRIRKIAKLLLITMVFLPLLGFSAVKKKDDNSFSLQQYGMTVDQVKQSAAQGSPDAEYALGYMFYYGKGLPRDEESARMWIGKAAAQGQPQAIKALQLLKQPGEGQVTGTKTATQSPTAKTQSATLDNQSNSTDGNTNTAAAASSQNDASNADVAPSATSGQNATVMADNSSATAPAAGSSAVNPTPLKKLNHKASAEHSVAKTKSASAATTGALTEQKLVHAPSHYYTIQLLGSYDKKDAVAFINRNKLQQKATYYHTTFNNKPWFVVVYGLYPSQKEAEASLKHLAPQLDKANPWVKSVALVQQSMKK